jgi:hypothetical protein
VSKVKRGNEYKRPEWEYAPMLGRKGLLVTQMDILEMLESIRNVLEEVRNRLPERRRKKIPADSVKP